MDGGGGGLLQILNSQQEDQEVLRVKKSLQFTDILYDLQNHRINVQIPEVNSEKTSKLLKSLELKLVKNPSWQKQQAPFLVAYSHLKQKLIEIDIDQYEIQINGINDKFQKRYTLRALGFHELMRHLKIEEDDDDYTVTTKYFKAIQSEGAIYCFYLKRNFNFETISRSGSPKYPAEGTSCMTTKGVVWEFSNRSGIPGWIDTEAKIFWDANFRVISLRNGRNSVQCNQPFEMPTGYDDIVDNSESDFTTAEKHGIHEIFKSTTNRHIFFITSSRAASLNDQSNLSSDFNYYNAGEFTRSISSVSWRYYGMVARCIERL